MSPFKGGSCLVCWTRWSCRRLLSSAETTSTTSLSTTTGRSAIKTHPYTCLSPSIRDVQMGDIIMVGECWPLRKTVCLTVLKVTKAASTKKQLQKFWDQTPTHFPKQNKVLFSFKNNSDDNNKLLLSHHFWGSKIWKWHIWLEVFCDAVVKYVGWGTVIWRLNWGWRICFYDSSLICWCCLRQKTELAHQKSKCGLFCRPAWVFSQQSTSLPPEEVTQKRMRWEQRLLRSHLRNHTLSFLQYPLGYTC